jgi:gamma-glutamylcyclotransferase (GGCT)/AIG2-like uncharacterized protein YtfP
MNYFFSSLALLVSVVSFIVIYFFVKKRTSADRILGEVRTAVQEIINEIDRVTDRDLELIDARAEQLKQLLSDVEKHILMYGREVQTMHKAEETKKNIQEEKHAAAEAAYREAGKRRPLPPLANTAGTLPLFANSGDAQPPEDKTGALSPIADSAVDPSLHNLPSPPPVSGAITDQDAVAAIVKLAASGASNTEIAKQLDIPVAAVEMARFMAKSS